jgi:excinuclease UvrABC ATPase subunit
MTPLSQHAADSHDLIRVQGARVNNLKDVSIEIPKRRLTVFTGVSGSGKSSLVFGTIAAESQRLINETYSTFVQNFMPSLARPDVDVLDGITTAIIVDQERMGANTRSTVGTATDANAMLRVLWSRLGKPHVGSSNAFSFNVPSVRAVGSITVEKGNKKAEKVVYNVTGGMCPRCEGMGQVNDIDLSQLYDENKSLNEGAITIPGYTPTDGWCGFSRVRGSTRTKPSGHSPGRSCRTFSTGEPRKVKVAGVNLTYEGLVPRIQKSFLSKDVDALQPHIRAVRRAARSRSPPAPSAAAHDSTRAPALRRSGASTSPTPARCRSTSWLDGFATSRNRPSPRCSRTSAGLSTRSSRSDSAT